VNSNDLMSSRGEKDFQKRATQWCINHMNWLDEMGRKLNWMCEYGRALPGERILEGGPFAYAGNTV